MQRKWVVHYELGRLNIVILRATPGVLNAFDDMLCAIYTNAVGGRSLFACRCTADPGKPSLEHPKRKDGTAVWAECQLVDGFMIGMHHGEYECFVPIVAVPVLRYSGLGDGTGTPSTSSSTQIHRANAQRESTVVGPWSEGCCVIANPQDYATLMNLGVAQVSTGRPRFTVSCMAWPRD